MIKLFILLTCSLVIGFRTDCNQKSVLQSLHTPTYHFSVRLLDRVAQETDGHFIFSPISTWLQLLALADGAEGETLNEIQKVTRHSMVCSGRIVKQIFNSLDRDLSEAIKRQSIFVIDKLLDVKNSFVTNVEMLNAVKVLEANFRNSTKPARTVNEIVDYVTNGKITDMLNDSDFIMTVLLIIDIASMKANWQSPFNPAYTRQEMFYSNEKVPLGYVNMMYQVGFFNFNNIPEINAQALEFPFNDRTSMILLLPNKKTENLFWIIKDINITSILKSLRSNGPRLINLKMPRFNLTTDIDNMPELLYDMGVKRGFSPRFAQFKKISDYIVYISMINSRFDIEVTEKGISANIAPETIIKPEVSIDVSFNKPFAFLLVDKQTKVILFAGIYSKPSLF